MVASGGGDATDVRRRGLRCAASSARTTCRSAMSAGCHVTRRRPQGAGRRRLLLATRRGWPDRARAPTPVDHRPEPGGGPAVPEGRVGSGLQRRDLQLPGSCERSSAALVSGSAPAPTPKSCWRHGDAGARQCLGRLRGMFAFALYDERTEELALVRDAVRHQAAVLRGSGRRRRVRLRAEGAAARRGHARRSTPLPSSPRCSTPGSPTATASGRGSASCRRAPGFR